MNSTITPKVSTSFIIVTLIIASAFMSLVFVNQVFAATPNILVGNNMTVGSEGADVVMLQLLLSETGYLKVPTNIAYGYFGPLTKAALARYQVAMSVTPSVGYFGPVTKVSMWNDYSSHGWLSLLGWNK